MAELEAAANPCAKPSGCIGLLSPGVAAVNALMNAGEMNRLNDDALLERCPNRPGPMSNEAKRETDQKMLCELMCCCAHEPNVSYSSKTGQTSPRYQSCVADTVLTANGLTSLLTAEMAEPVSRYWPEVTYDMTCAPPNPLTRGGTPTYGSEGGRHWGQFGAINRHAKELGWDRGEQGPPTRRPDNIDRIYEMKFRGDEWGDGQERSYHKIAGEQDKVEIVKEEECNCGDRKNTPDPVLLPMAMKRNAERLAAKQTQSLISWENIGKGVAVVGVGVVIIGAAASGAGPFAAALMGLGTLATQSP
ncbi:MAG: VRR-NUC domain-containing protein [Candidatus Methylumidiphilus sp.]